jgi:hypothetical protein
LLPIPEARPEEDWVFFYLLSKGAIRMRLSHLLVAGAAAASLGAVAAEQSKQEPQQSGQTGSQSAASGASAQTPAQTGQSQQQASHNADTIKQAQEKLSALGLDPGPADGKVGAKTRAAVKQFQQSKGLKASGQLDQPTLAALGVSAEDAASTRASSATPGTGATTSPEQSSAAAAGSSSEQPKSQEQPKGKSSN